MTSLFSARLFRVYIVPGAVFQSVMIGGGYGTGREIVEYFTMFGFSGGLLGLGTSCVVLAIVLGLTFEFARKFALFDYRNFFKRLLGRGWIAFEILIVLQFLLVLAVLAAAAGNILRDSFGIGYGFGLAIMLAAIGVMTYYGRELVARILTLWSFVLYAVILSFFVVVLRDHGAAILSAAGGGGVDDGWWQSGFKYALYNLATAPLLLYVARSFESRSEALASGAIAAAIAIIPAVLFHVAFFTAWPAILEQPVPVYWLMAQAEAKVLIVVYSIMLFGTFIETGAGMLQGINERLDAYLIEVRGHGLGRRTHATLAMLAIVISAVLSTWGITNLIASGYGTMAWGFLLVYALPLVTIGLLRIMRSGPGGDPASARQS